jgi:protocatechuate 3,4-dioxygenase beta subunit
MLAMTETKHSLTRRGAIGAAGAAGLAFLVGGVRPGAGTIEGGVEQAFAATCVMTPAKTVGPYFVDEKLKRSDVRGGQGGVPLTLTMHVFDADKDCAPVSGAAVDIWHCNAGGLYSDIAANGTTGQTWLRGLQTTDGDGKVTFTTMWPGWYSGRAIHIHFKVRVYDGAAETLEFTSQMFFTDEMNATILKQAPYNTRGSTPDVTDATDNIYGSDGAKLLLAPTADGRGGYSADFSVGVSSSTSQLGNSSAGGGPGGGPGGRPPGGDTVVDAGVSSVGAVRAASGRQVKVGVIGTDAVTAVAKVTRGGRTLATRTVELAAGTHSFRVPIGAKVAAGAATVKVVLTDAAGNTKTATRTVHVAKRG